MEIFFLVNGMIVIVAAIVYMHYYQNTFEGDTMAIIPMTIAEFNAKYGKAATAEPSDIGKYIAVHGTAWVPMRFWLFSIYPDKPDDSDKYFVIQIVEEPSDDACPTSVE